MKLSLIVELTHKKFKQDFKFFWKSDMLKKENPNKVQRFLVTFYFAIFCYIIYICSPIHCPPDNFENSTSGSQFFNTEHNVSQNYTTSKYGLNFELTYEIR